LQDTVGYLEHPKPQSPWATRMQAAYANAVENLVVFATLVLVAQVAGISNRATVIACTVYFWSRVVRLLAHTFAVPWVRTLAFVAGFGSQITQVWQLLAR